MSTMLMLGLAFGAGFGTGWVVCEKPEWARNLWDEIRNKVIPR